MSRLDRALVGLEQLEDPRIIDRPRGTRLLHVEALAWAAARLTDGHISRGSLRRLTDEPDAEAAAASLVAAGLWAAVDNGWQIINYIDDQISRQDVEEIRKKGAERQRRSRQHNAGDHSLCDPEKCWGLKRSQTESADTTAVTARTTDGGRNASRDSTSSDTFRDESGRDDAIEIVETRRQRRSARLVGAAALPAHGSGNGHAKPFPRAKTGPATTDELDEALDPYRRIEGQQVDRAVTERVALLIPSYGAFEVSRELGRASFSATKPVDWQRVLDTAEGELRKRFGVIEADTHAAAAEAI